MTDFIERAKQDWYPIAMVSDPRRPKRFSTKVLGKDIVLETKADGSLSVFCGNKSWKITEAFGHIWMSPSQNPKPLFSIPEENELDRRLVPCGVVHVRCSPLRAVENFLDIAHFPFVHTDILGSEPHTEVNPYKVDIDESKDEVVATKVKFFQPQAAKSANEGIITEYIYRVPAPMTAILYKTCPNRNDVHDIITLFVQPLDEDNCAVWPWMALYDDESSMADMVEFQQLIFLQDRNILENQIPRRLPIDPKMEIPTRADLTSVAYRRWLKKSGALYGALTHPAEQTGR